MVQIMVQIFRETGTDSKSAVSLSLCFKGFL